MGNKKNHNRKTKKKANNWRGIIKMRKKNKNSEHIADERIDDGQLKLVIDTSPLLIVIQHDQWNNLDANESAIDNICVNMSQNQPKTATSSPEFLHNDCYGIVDENVDAFVMNDLSETPSDNSGVENNSMVHGEVSENGNVMKDDLSEVDTLPLLIVIQHDQWNNLDANESAIDNICVNMSQNQPKTATSSPEFLHNDCYGIVDENVDAFVMNDLSETRLETSEALHENKNGAKNMPQNQPNAPTDTSLELLEDSNSNYRYCGYINSRQHQPNAPTLDLLHPSSIFNNNSGNFVDDLNEIDGSSSIRTSDYDQSDFEADENDNGTENIPDTNINVYNDNDESLNRTENFQETQSINDSRSENNNEIIENINIDVDAQENSSQENIENTEEQSQKEEPELSGRRIVDIKHFFDKIQQLSRHSDTCHFDDMVCTDEKRIGLNSTFEFHCTVCGYDQCIYSCDHGVPINVNSAAVLGVTSIGLGSYHLNEFCANLKIPQMSDYMLDVTNKKQQDDWWLLAKLEASGALQEEIRLARLYGDIDSKGNALIVIVCDGSWPKRSYNKNFTSLSGCAVIIGVRTNKVIYFDTKDKYCHICTIAKSKNLEPKEHTCNTNYSGPSSSMETAIIVEGFKHCEALGARFKEMISDGDSSTYATIRDLNIYADPPLSVEKDECCNHLYRNFRKAFGALGKASKKFKKDSRKHITKRKGNDICMGVQSAAKHWRNSNVDTVEKLVNLEKDVLNAPFHYFGIHDDCQKYFCSKDTQPTARRNVDILKSDGIFDEILNLCHRYFASSVPSLVLNYNNNKAESFNGLIAKYLGGKRINYCLARSYRARVAQAVVQYNTGGHSGSAYHEFKNSTATEQLKALEESRIKKCARNAIVKAAKPKNSRFSEQEPDTGIGYGENRHDTDMSSHFFEIAKTRFMETLREDQTNRDFINRSTIGNSLNRTWRDKRKKLLTPWYFGKVINARNPKSYKNILKDIVWKDLEISDSADVRHQKIYEKKALRCFTLVHKAEYISQCGLIIDDEHCFLGASPFRLYQDNGIVFIKCPVKAYNMNILDAIEKNLIPFYKTVAGVITVNQKSAWYMEVQGELHIAYKSFAYVVIWLGCEFHIKKVQRDDTFWEDTMEKPLVYFYEEVMVKELVDPRKKRRMEPRAYNSDTKSFE